MGKIKFKGDIELIEKPKYYTVADCDNGDLFMYNNSLYLMIDTCGMLAFSFDTCEIKDFENKNTDPVAIYFGQMEVEVEKFHFI